MTSWLTRQPAPHRHPSDDELTLLALAGIHSSDVLVAVHVRACPACAQRMVHLETSLASQRAELAVEADRLFPAARLERQRFAVLQRIGGGRTGARVLAFPRHASVEPLRRHETLRRYVAAAAVAGLLVGAVAGRLFEPGSDWPRREARTANRVTLERTAPLEARQTLTAAEEAFLRDYETAVGSTRVEALRTLDELTPHPVGRVASR
jgi:hypothetical protein